MNWPDCLEYAARSLQAAGLALCLYALYRAVRPRPRPDTSRTTSPHPTFAGTGASAAPPGLPSPPEDPRLVLQRAWQTAIDTDFAVELRYGDDGHATTVPGDSPDVGLHVPAYGPLRVWPGGATAAAAGGRRDKKFGLLAKEAACNPPAADVAPCHNAGKILLRAAAEIEKAETPVQFKPFTTFTGQERAPEPAEVRALYADARRGAAEAVA